jgi:hypothetical protein
MGIDIIVQDGSVFATFDALRRFQCPYVARLLEGFTTHAVSTNGSPGLALIYECFPGAIRLVDLVKAARPDEYVRHVPVWIAQVLYLIWSVHQSGLACDDVLRIENFILPPGNQKIVLTGFGLVEVLNLASNTSPGSVSGTSGVDAAPTLADRQVINFHSKWDSPSYNLLWGPPS